jgi:putative hydrolase of the HAD superfamily
VLFDVGGTLISEDPRDSIVPFLQRQGATFNSSRLLEAITKADAYHSAHQDSAKTWDDALHVWRGFDQILLETLEVDDVPKLTEALLASWNDPHVWPLLPGVRESLEALTRGGYRLAVISNWDGGLERVLDVVGLRQYFEFVMASATFGTRKPDPRIFHGALERLGLPASEVVYVGNNLAHDAQAARAVGIQAVLVPSFGQELRADADLEHILVLKTLHDLIGRIEAAWEAA